MESIVVAAGSHTVFHDAGQYSTKRYCIFFNWCFKLLFVILQNLYYVKFSNIILALVTKIVVHFYTDFSSSYHLYAKSGPLQPTWMKQRFIPRASKHSRRHVNRVTDVRAEIQSLRRDPKTGRSHQPQNSSHLTNLYIVTGNTKTYLRNISLPFNSLKFCIAITKWSV